MQMRHDWIKDVDKKHDLTNSNKRIKQLQHDRIIITVYCVTTVPTPQSNDKLIRQGSH